MELLKEQYKQIKDCFPKQRKPAKISNLDVLNAVLYVVENGCKWRGLPKEYGDWHVIYVRVNRWAKKGVLQAVFLRLQQLGIIQIESPFRRIKRFRRIFIRYEKLDVIFLAFVYFALVVDVLM